MGKRRAGKLLVYGIVLFLLLWPAVQIYDSLHSRPEKQDAVHLLYQVSLFQMELLNRCLQEGSSVKDTGELNAWKQALYAASYTHERLVLAVGEEELTPLNSLQQLMQYMLRLQIGGERPLKPEELRTLEEAGKQFSGMYDAYQKLFASGSRIMTSGNEELKKGDASLSEFMRKKLLQ